MSMWAGMCQLIAESASRDEYGVVTAAQTAREVPCNVFEVSAATYYAASAAGIHPQAVLEIRACAYGGERLVRYGGATLAVARVQRTADNVRLTLVERTGERERD